MSLRTTLVRSGFAWLFVVTLATAAGAQDDPGPPVEEAKPKGQATNPAPVARPQPPPKIDAPPQVEPVQKKGAQPTREAIKAGLAARRNALAEMEGQVAALRDQVKLELGDAVAGQKAAVDGARKRYEDAKKGRERAEFEVKEYLQATFGQDKVTAQGEIAVARNDEAHAKREAERIHDLSRRGVVAAHEVVRAELTHQQSLFILEQAQTKLEVLEKYTKDKETKKRQAAVAAAEAVEAEAKGLLELELAREAKVKEETERLKVRSPEDLVLTLLDDAVRAEGRVVALIGEAQKIEAQIRDKPGDAASLAEKLAGKKAEAEALMKQAKASLLEAARNGDQVQRIRSNLRDAEANLKKEREKVEWLEKVMSRTP